MKKLLVGLMVLGSISSFAGEIVSRDSYERVEFIHNTQTNTLSIVSYTPLVESKEIRLKKIERDRSSISLFAAIDGVQGPQGGYDEWGPGALPFAAIYDVALFPFKATIKGFKNKQLKKDYTLLMEAINTDADVKVSQNRFERIVKLLK